MSYEQRYEQQIKQATYARDMQAKSESAMAYDQRAVLGTVGGANQIAPRSTMENALDSLSNGLDEAFCAVGRLAERLQHVLQPEMGKVEIAGGMTTASVPEPPYSAAVCRLHGLRRQLDDLTIRVNSLTVRLDT